MINYVNQPLDLPLIDENSFKVIRTKTLAKKIRSHIANSKTTFIERGDTNTDIINFYKQHGLIIEKGAPPELVNEINRLHKNGIKNPVSNAKRNVDLNKHRNVLRPTVQLKRDVLKKDIYLVRNLNTTSNKAFTQSNAPNLATTMHKIQGDAIKQAQINSSNKKGDLATNNKKTKSSVNKTVNRSSSDTVKNNTFGKWFRNNPSMQKFNMGITNFAKKHPRMLAASVVLGGIMAASKIASAGRNLDLNITPSYSGNNARSAYLPNSYRRGFDEIKQLTTDFGSRIHLDKTVSKQMVTPPSTTRNGYTRSVNSTINGNLSLALHKNAIQHTRY